MYEGGVPLMSSHVCLAHVNTVPSSRPKPITTSKAWSTTTPFGQASCVDAKMPERSPVKRRLTVLGEFYQDVTRSKLSKGKTRCKADLNLQKKAVPKDKVRYHEVGCAGSVIESARASSHSSDEASQSANRTQTRRIG